MDVELKYINLQNELYAEAKKIRIDCFFANMNNAEELINDIFEENGIHLVCVKKNKAIGTGRIHTINSIAVISQMAIKKENQKSGVGSKILRELIHKCKSLGMNRIELSARETAFEFYKKSGFEAFGEKYASKKTGITHQKMRLKINNID